MAEVRGGRARGRRRLGWMDGVNVALGNRGITVEAARNTRKIGMPFHTPSRALVVITLREEGCGWDKL